MTQEVDGKVFISRQSRNFLFIVFMIKELFPSFNLTWRVKIMSFAKEKVRIGKTKALVINILSHLDDQLMVLILTRYSNKLTFFIILPG